MTRIACNTASHRAHRTRLRFSDAELLNLQEALRRNGAPPAWYYDDSYDEPIPTLPRFGKL